MLFFLFLLGIIVIFMIITILLILSTIKVQIENVRVGNLNGKDRWKIKFSICLFNKIPLFWLKLDKSKIKKITSSNRIKKLNIQKYKSKIKINKKELKVLTKLKIDIEKLNLKIDLGLEDAPLTSYVATFISVIISTILGKCATNIENCKYNINTIYNGKIMLKMELNSIFSIKIVHIIYIIYILIMKGSKNYERGTSNRRSYGYSYGQY